MTHKREDIEDSNSLLSKIVGEELNTDIEMMYEGIKDSYSDDKNNIISFNNKNIFRKD